MGFHGHHWTDEMRASRNRHLGSPLDRLYAHVEPDTNGGCWLWTGTLIKSTGYGQIQVDGRAISAHRLSFELFNGQIPAARNVLHSCDVRACVNPHHLRAGTPLDNVIDTIVRGRRRALFGDQHSGAKLREQDVPVIRARLRQGHTCLAIARDYGVTDCAINALRRGRTWWRVPDDQAAAA